MLSNLFNVIHATEIQFAISIHSIILEIFKKHHQFTKAQTYHAKRKFQFNRIRGIVLPRARNFKFPVSPVSLSRPIYDAEPRESRDDLAPP